jgi:hypothetical protein
MDGKEGKHQFASVEASEPMWAFGKFACPGGVLGHGADQVTGDGAVAGIRYRISTRPEHRETREHRLWREMYAQSNPKACMKRRERRAKLLPKQACRSNIYE